VAATGCDFFPFLYQEFGDRGNNPVVQESVDGLIRKHVHTDLEGSLIPAFRAGRVFAIRQNPLAVKSLGRKSRKTGPRDPFCTLVVAAHLQPIIKHLYNRWLEGIYPLSMPKTPSLPWWYLPNANGDDTMDRSVDSGLPILPQQIEIRDGGIFWSFDPQHEFPRVDSHSDARSQVVSHLELMVAVLHQRSQKQNRLSDDYLQLVGRYMRHTTPRSAPVRRVLTDFLELQQSGAKDVLKYAKLYGVLDICEHGIPHGHHSWCAPTGWPLDGWTSLDVWRTTSRRFAAILRIASDLKGNTRARGRKEDWDVVFSTVLSEEARKLLVVPANHEMSLNTIQNMVNHYLRLGEVAPMLARTSAGSKFYFAGNPLYPLLGTLAMQLAINWCDVEVLYTCSGCGKMYERGATVRRPKRGTANYCPGCGKRTALLAAKSRYRSKLVLVRDLSLQGLSADDIGCMLDSPVAKVRQWITVRKRNAQANCDPQ
jgi:hypothetical protein